MNTAKITGERLVVLFLLGVVVLNPPFLLIFDVPAEIAGIPVLYLYLFAVWAMLITFLALATEFSSPEPEGNLHTMTQDPGQESKEIHGVR